MNGEMEAAGALGAVRVVPPGYTARTRAGLPAAVRTKLDLLESDGVNKLALVRAVGDRMVETRAEVVAAQQRIAMQQAAATHRHVDLTNEQAELADAEDRLARLTTEREAAQERWQNARRLVEACRVYLGLG